MFTENFGMYGTWSKRESILKYKSWVVVVPLLSFKGRHNVGTVNENWWLVDYEWTCEYKGKQLVGDAARWQTHMAQCINLQSSCKFNYSLSSVAAGGAAELHSISSCSFECIRFSYLLGISGFQQLLSSLNMSVYLKVCVYIVWEHTDLYTDF